MDLSVEDIRINLQMAGELIDRSLTISGESHRRVKIMVVTKTHPAEVVGMAMEAGAELFGENRVSEGGRKIMAVGRDAAEFHMIGPIHTGEVRQAVRDFHWIDSIGRLKISDEIARRIAGSTDPQPGLLVEVNTSGEPAKHGFRPDAGLLEDVLGHMEETGLSVSGLMTVGPLGADGEETARAFSSLRRLRDELSGRCGHDLEELSMGMSDDFELAVLEGATTVRLGRFILGPRKRR